MASGQSDDVINLDHVTKPHQCLNECSKLKRSGNSSLAGIDAMTTDAYHVTPEHHVCRCLIGFKYFVWTRYYSFFFHGQYFLQICFCFFESHMDLI